MFAPTMPCLRTLLLIVSAPLILLSGCDNRPTNPRYTIPSVLTRGATSITTTSAECGGTVNTVGRPVVTSRGICWSQTGEPTIDDNRVEAGSGDGAFTVTLDSLDLGRAYYYRAYAINSAGVSYGAYYHFTTLTLAPTVTTDSVGNVGQTTARCWYNVISDGGAGLTSRGICWNTSGTPTVLNTKLTDNRLLGQSSLLLTGLTGNTTYYVRAFAENSKGLIYGEQISFLTAPLPPNMQTEYQLDVTQTAMTIGGILYSDGGRPITAQGVCWSTTTMPDFDDSVRQVTEVDQNGRFYTRVEGLTANRVYYFRAWATNEVGTVFGVNRSARTLSWPKPYMSVDNGSLYRSAMNSSVTDPELVFTVIDSVGPAAGQTIQFEILTGDGHLASTSALTDSYGKARPSYTFSGVLGYATLRAIWPNKDTIDVRLRASTIIPGYSPQGQYIRLGDSLSLVKAFNGEPVSNTPDAVNYLNYVDYRDSLGLVFVIADHDRSGIGDDNEPVYGVFMSGRFAEKSADGWGVGSSINNLLSLYGVVTPTYSPTPVGRYKYHWPDRGLTAYTTTEGDESARTILEIQLKGRWNYARRSGAIRSEN